MFASIQDTSKEQKKERKETTEKEKEKEKENKKKNSKEDEEKEASLIGESQQRFLSKLKELELLLSSLQKRFTQKRSLFKTIN